MNNAKRTPKAKAPPDLLSNIERVVVLSGRKPKSEESRKEHREELKQHLSSIAGKLGLTRMEALIFSHILEKSGSSPVTPQKLAQSLKCSHVRLIKNINYLESLEKKSFVLNVKHRGENSYTVPVNVVMSLRKGKRPAPARRLKLKTEELFHNIEEIYSNCENKEISREFFFAELNYLLDDNKQLDFCRLITGYQFELDELIFLIMLCKNLVLDNRDSYDIDDLLECKDLLSFPLTVPFFVRELRKGLGQLFEEGLIQHANAGGFVNSDTVELTQKAKNELLGAFELKSIEYKKGLIQWADLKEKRLFYNKEEAVQISRLAGLLNEQNFRVIVSRLEENNMRSGFACLFSGPPGTGKTETAYQLARATGRSIMPVDISQTKSMWYGGSEKIIKDIFNSYQGHIRQAEKAGERVPILLFNEADAVIAKRRELGHGNLTQTENTIQNIILEELENMRGILIATTNLLKNMDSAFERRFLFKIEFAKPSLEVRQNIWRNFLPLLSVEECNTLSSTFDLSGGQIENVVRKCTVENILGGISPDIDSVMAFCREETMMKSSHRIGFGVKYGK